MPHPVVIAFPLCDDSTVLCIIKNEVCLEVDPEQIPSLSQLISAFFSDLCLHLNKGTQKLIFVVLPDIAESMSLKVALTIQ